MKYMQKFKINILEYLFMNNINNKFIFGLKKNISNFLDLSFLRKKIKKMLYPFFFHWSTTNQFFAGFWPAFGSLISFLQTNAMIYLNGLLDYLSCSTGQFCLVFKTHVCVKWNGKKKMKESFLGTKQVKSLLYFMEMSFCCCYN